MVTRDEARSAKESLRTSLQHVDGISGVGLARRSGDADWVLQVNVVTLSARKDVPPDVDGVPVQVQVVGAVTAL